MPGLVLDIHIITTDSGIHYYHLGMCTKTPEMHPTVIKEMWFIVVNYSRGGRQIILGILIKYIPTPL